MPVPARFEIDHRIRDNTTEAAPGAFVWAPRGVQHSGTVDADGTRAFILTTPGGHLEAILRPCGEPAATLELPPVPNQPPFKAMLDHDRQLGVVYPDLGVTRVPERRR